LRRVAAGNDLPLAHQDYPAGRGGRQLYVVGHKQNSHPLVMPPVAVHRRLACGILTALREERDAVPAEAWQCP